MNTRIFALLLLTALACNPDEPQVVGRWQNSTKQLLVIEKDLSGRLTQQARCAPDLRITMHRDPFDAYALFFEENQPIYFPLVQQALFQPNEFFCSSKDSIAMCRFCRLTDPDHLDCESTEQKITGLGSLVTHECAWVRVQTSSTSTAAPGCPMTPDAGTGCRAIGIDNGDPDAGVGPDSG